ncbi:nucleotidyltransferase domain-containing protein [Gracilimonas mengyeensis]|uniref:Predicted nucleotidyltransferase n=1 Tax=Gracilimonas mengyeensis TaxID=1302730 RepID=A0A521FFG6_9BACT|nr:nucleotidyltransferase domain-containing protein [Gracilimonas mengyeensis]SMO94845.1 Predicted nucleotidyltransferase [Gracilimonas mengyeensis]
MYGLKESVWEQIFGCFEKHEAIQEVILYGSRAKGNFKPASDIDLVIRGNDMSERELTKVENELDDLLLPWKIDLSLFHHLQNEELIKHIKRGGKSIYSKQSVTST